MRFRLRIDVPVEPWRAAWLRRALALFTLAMLAATWRLWTPQTVFPRVPLLYAARSFSSAAEWLVVGAAVGGLLAAALVFRPDWAWRAGLRVFASALAGLIVLDQHRLQPWAYQALLVALALANLPAPRGFALIRWLTTSIYFYSGLSKLDYEFLHSLGQQLLSGLVQFFATNIDAWPESWRLIAAVVFPLAEIAISIGFVFQKSRRCALIASLVLHSVLLLVLGPWGLHHSLAVLMWNGYFMVQNVLLFGKRAVANPAASADAADGARSRRNVAGQFALADRGPFSVRPLWLSVAMNLTTQAALGAAMLLPIMEPWGWFDAWPSWALYAPSSERVTLLVHRTALGRLGRLERFAEFDADSDAPWVRLRTDRWSLDDLAAPIYPQNRFQLGVAEALGAGLHLDHRIRAVEIGRSDRFTGRRQHQTRSGISEISAAADGFLLNARPAGRLLLAPQTGTFESAERR